MAAGLLFQWPRDNRMQHVRKAGDRGRTDWGWLDSRHTFSFGEYHDPAHRGFRTLRVINDDRVQPGGGFGAHAHRDMEILSFVLEGGLQHRDSLGNGSVIRPGEIQHMRAGTGITHSEFNASREAPVHFLQIWIVPGQRSLTPVYAQRAWDPQSAAQGLVRLASADGAQNSIALLQDVDVWYGALAGAAIRTLPLRPGRAAWVHVARGAATVNGTSLAEGDGMALEDEPRVDLVGGPDADVLIFDLA